MNQYKKKMYDLSGPKTAEALNKRHFEAYYCSTAAEAVKKVLELTPKTDVVSWGGAMTVDELGIKQRMAQEGYTLLDRDTAQTPEEKQAIMRQALTCGTFLMSSNAISKDGQLVNIDGNGNRVAAMCFGPRQVVVVAGMNTKSALRTSPSTSRGSETTPLTEILSPLHQRTGRTPSCASPRTVLVVPGNSNVSTVRLSF